MQDDRDDSFVVAMARGLFEGVLYVVAEVVVAVVQGIFDA
jgi:hypothetical protein